MKVTGIVRRMDELGRVVIPKELQRRLGIKAGTPMELYLSEGGILCKPYDVTLELSNTLDGLLSRVDEYDLLESEQTEKVRAHIQEIQTILATKSK